MNLDFTELKNIIQKSLEKKEIIVDSISYKEENKYKFLTIVLDKVGGIDLDLIVSATKIINPIVDKYNLPFDNYILDVVSKERG
jgi:ribosome maturation factor RimP